LGRNKKILILAAPQLKIQCKQKCKQKYDVCRVQRGRGKNHNEKILTLAAPRTKYDNQKYGMHWGQRGRINNTECIVGDGGRGRPRLLLIVVVGLAANKNDATKNRNKKF
jgi:hypothetical protein